MKIRIDGDVYEGTGTEIIDRLRGGLMDPTEFPDTESYLQFLRRNALRLAGTELTLPRGDTERRCRSMIAQLEKIGALEVLEDA